MMEMVILGGTIVIGMVLASLWMLAITVNMMLNKKFMMWFVKKYMKLLENIRGEDVTYFIVYACLFAFLGSLANEIEVSNGSESTGQFILHSIVTVGASTHSNNDVTCMQIGVVQVPA